MKRKDYSRHAPKSSLALYRPAGTARGETAVFGTLGLVGFAAVCLALTWGAAPARPHDSPLAGYFRSGKMEADLRTTDAMVQYLMEADLPRPTNVMDQAAQKNIPVLTNSVRPKPRA